MSARFKLTEQDIQGQIIDYLRIEQARGRVVWFERSNGGGMKDKTGRLVLFYWLYLRGKIPRSKGKSDLSGMLAGGRFFALEVKRRDEKPTKEQLDYLAAVREGGGIAAVVRNFNDAKNVLFGDGIKAVLAEEEMNHET
ncbi:MAG: hypothetical protein IPK73_30015 [Candidatus Obscuribacter sp.]|nr:hypothetical protein [Candidatus Obscuribacter sp.]